MRRNGAVGTVRTPARDGMRAKQAFTAAIYNTHSQFFVDLIRIVVIVITKVVYTDEFGCMHNVGRRRKAHLHIQLVVRYHHTEMCELEMGATAACSAHELKITCVNSGWRSARVDSSR